MMGGLFEELCALEREVKQLEVAVEPVLGAESTEKVPGKPELAAPHSYIVGRMNDAIQKVSELRAAVRLLTQRVEL